MMRRFRRLMVSELIEKGLDPTLAYSELDKNGKLTGVPHLKNKKAGNKEVQEITEQVVFASVEVPEKEEDKQEKVEEPVTIVASEVKKVKEKKNVKKSKNQV